MCGLFGTIRPHRYDPGVRRAAAAALLDLGHLAEERGTDSAGIATLHSTWRRGNRSSAGGESAPPSALSPTTCRATRGCGAISAPRGWSWATPGGPPKGARTLGNASPMTIGDIIGTHNGDVTAPVTRTGSTDSAWLFGQLDPAGSIKATTAATPKKYSAGRTPEPPGGLRRAVPRNAAFVLNDMSPVSESAAQFRILNVSSGLLGPSSSA